MGFTASGYLPYWAENDPSRNGMAANDLPNALSDLHHHASFAGQLMPVTSDNGLAEETEVFSTGIDCDPFPADPRPLVPVVNVQIIDDYWIYDLDPDGVAEVAAKLRAQADRLDHEVRPALIAARADWIAHHPDPYPNRLTPESGPQPLAPPPPTRTTTARERDTRATGR